VSRSVLASCNNWWPVAFKLCQRVRHRQSHAKCAPVFLILLPCGLFIQCSSAFSHENTVFVTVCTQNNIYIYQYPPFLLPVLGTFCQVSILLLRTLERQLQTVLQLSFPFVPKQTKAIERRKLEKRGNYRKGKSLFKP
jgi:hypothetical protein